MREACAASISFLLPVPVFRSCCARLKVSRALVSVASFCATAAFVLQIGVDREQQGAFRHRIAFPHKKLFHPPGLTVPMNTKFASTQP